MPQLDYGAPSNFGGLALGRPAAQSRPLRVIDRLPLKACHFIKIDVEGMERAVLNGAREVIRRHRPLLYVENDRPRHSRALLSLLFGLGYRLYWHLPSLFNPRNFLANPENVFGSIVSINVLAVPQERAQQLPLKEIATPEDKWRI